MRRFLFYAMALVAGLLLVGCGGISLAEDVTPPPDYQPTAVESATQAPQQAEVSGAAFPLVPPDPAQGAAIYTEKCLPCHGATGMGDGPQSNKLPNRPPSLGSPDTAHKAKPVDWFNMITNGNIQNMMPGFSGSLNDRQRWDLVAYVYTLSTTPEALSQGKVLYDTQCAVCHGATGKGDGTQAQALAGQIPDWSQPQRLVQFSAQDLEQLIANGKGNMPGFAASLKQEERWSLVDTIRSLTYASSQPGTAGKVTVDGAPAAASGSIIVRGTVSMGSGSPTAAGLKVTLLGFDGMNQVFSKEAVTRLGGAYEFKDVDAQPTLAYMVQVDSNGYPFNSDVLHAKDVKNGLAELPVTLYETTSSTTGLAIDRLHIFFDFTKSDLVQVVELFIVTNSTDKMVVPAADGSPVLTFEVPQGADNLQFDGGSMGQRFVQTAKGFGDLSPVAPGAAQHQVLFSYELPYDCALALSVPVSMPVSAAVVMVPPLGVKLQSSQLTAAGKRDVQGMAFELYTAADLPAGQNLEIKLSGKVRSTASTSSSTTTTNLLIGLGVFIAALGGAVYWVLRQRKAAVAVSASLGVESQPVSQDAILDAILALDDLHQAGKLPDEAYQERRSELKARLRRLTHPEETPRNQE